MNAIVPQEFNDLFVCFFKQIYTKLSVSGYLLNIFLETYFYINKYWELILIWYGAILFSTLITDNNSVLLSLSVTAHSYTI